MNVDVIKEHAKKTKHIEKMPKGDNPLLSHLIAPKKDEITIGKNFGEKLTEPLLSADIALHKV